MRARQSARCAFVAAVAGALVAGLMSGCSSARPDRAGGGAAREPTVVVQLATEGDAPPAQVKLWADKVRDLSHGDIEIRYLTWQHKGESNYESSILADVRAGTADAAWVGARSLDLAGANAFQAMLAPFLVDSVSLERRLFDQGIPQQMLQQVALSGLVPLGVLPGPLRRVIGRDRDFTAAVDFRGATMAMQDSALASRALEALQSLPRALAPHIFPRYVDGYEQQLESMWLNHFERYAGNVAANVVLWPRPVVIVMGSRAFGALTPAQQAALTNAGELVLEPSVDAVVAEERAAMIGLCGAGVRFPVASASDLDSLRRVVEPVYRELRADGRTAMWLSQIQAAKAELKKGPDLARCQAAAGAGEGIPDGTYVRTMAKEDFIQWPGPRLWEPPLPGLWTLRLERGVLTITNPAGDSDSGTYRAFKGRIEARGATTFDATYQLGDGTLTFDRFTLAGCYDCGGYAVALGGMKPWARQ